MNRPDFDINLGGLIFMDEQNKNLILATVLSFLVILIWFMLFPPEEVTQPVDTATTEQSVDPNVPNVAPRQQAPRPPRHRKTRLSQHRA